MVLLGIAAEPGTALPIPVRLTFRRLLLLAPTAAAGLAAPGVRLLILRASCSVSFVLLAAGCLTATGVLLLLLVLPSSRLAVLLCVLL